MIAEEKGIEKAMATKVDFYSGFVYKMLTPGAPFSRGITYGADYK